jgi:hypothetical protein
VSVGPMTAMLPVVPASVQSGVSPLGDAAIGQEPAAPALPDSASVRTVAATQAANAMKGYTRENFTVVTLSQVAFQTSRAHSGRCVPRGRRSQLATAGLLAFFVGGHESKANEMRN